MGNVCYIYKRISNTMCITGFVVLIYHKLSQSVKNNYTNEMYRYIPCFEYEIKIIIIIIIISYATQKAKEKNCSYSST